MLNFCYIFEWRWNGMECEWGRGGCTRVMQFAFAIRLKVAFSCEELATTGKNHTRENTEFINFLEGRKIEGNRKTSHNIVSN